MSYDNHNYVPTQQLFSLTSLEKRRYISNIVFLHDIINGKIPSKSVLGEIQLKQPARNLRSNEIFKVKNFRTNFGRFIH